jgi:hypothetical protein
MEISQNKKYIFIHNQKTGGSSIERYLRATVADSKNILTRHAYARDGMDRLGPQAWGGFYTFGFVRNPWSRLVSWYCMIEGRRNRANRNQLFKYVLKNSTNFEEFLHNCTEPLFEINHRGQVFERSFLRNQIEYFTDESGRLAVSYIGRFENLAADFLQVQHHLGLPPLSLPHLNQTKPKDYRSFYQRSTKALVAKRFEKDIDYFGYTFEGGSC